MKKKRFKVVIWHGESKTLYYVVYIPDGEVYVTSKTLEFAQGWCKILEQY